MTDAWATDRIALVTGATSGFGEAMARRLLAGGGRVIATGRRADRLAALGAELATERLLTRVLDVREDASIADLLSGLPEPFQAIDILFNNAGLALGLKKAHEADIDDWQTMIDTNVLVDVAVRDPVWNTWSRQQLKTADMEIHLIKYHVWEFPLHQF
jgi:3-hydroxy acid dehydrogenase/malonic semialdehyde reductase